MPSSDRYFRNKASGKEDDSSKGKSTTKLSSTEKRQKELWESQRTCSNLATYFHRKCLDPYEGGKSPTSFSGSLGTLYHDALGPRVYLRLRMAQYLKQQSQSQTDKIKKEIATLLQTALHLAQEAVRYETQKLQQSTRRVRVTLLEGPYVGAKAMLATLHQELGKSQLALEHANELILFLHRHTQSMHSSECEVLYGRAGAIQAILFLRQQLGDDTLGSGTVVAMAQTIVQEGLRTAARNKYTRLPLLWEWHESQYLGAAHGVVGILHTLLCLTSDERRQVQVATKVDDLNTLIEQTLHALNSLCWPESGNLRSSIDSSSSHDKLVHWCHGAPGHILLLARAYHVFGRKAYLEQAKQLAENVIWPRGLLRKGVGLCHGISGNAYCFLALVGNDDDTCWRKRACYFAAYGVEKFESLEYVPDQPYSVYVGTGGLVSLLMDLGTLAGQAQQPGGASEESTAFRSALCFPLYDF